MIKKLEIYIMKKLWIFLEQYFARGNYRFDYDDRDDLRFANNKREIKANYSLSFDKKYFSNLKKARKINDNRR